MILLVDFGSQTAHLIGRRLRELGAAVVKVDAEDAYHTARKARPAGIVFSGGPASVYEKNAPTVNSAIFTLGIPILGICYGQQLIAHLLPQGKTVKDKTREDGPATLTIDKDCPLLAGLPVRSAIWMSHGDTVMRPPAGFEFVAHSGTIASAAMQDKTRQIYGLQFHPEVTHTAYGELILTNFLTRVCQLPLKKRGFNLKEAVNRIKTTVGKEKVIAAVSGGVDSTVAAALVAKAVGKQLRVIYVDNGLMRLGTKEEVGAIFQNKLKINLKIVSCQEDFLKALKGVTDPEEKRKIIGRKYIEIFEKEAKKLKNVRFLVQGTIYSDVIESQGSKHAAKIKSHHNVGGLPEKMGLKLIEPLREFYKDEVKAIGRQLGLPATAVSKQPFPGPGQAIRIIGAITKARLARQQQADQIVLEEITKAGLYGKIFQSFPIMTGAMSTAVKGDGRFYGEVVALRIYDSADIMSASWSRLPYDFLQKLVSRITNEVAGVSRVVYDITTKPPATMEWE